MAEETVGAKSEKAGNSQESSTKAESSQNSINTKTLVIAAVLALLIIVSGVQAMELAGLKEQINTGLSGVATLSSGEKTAKTTTPSNTLQKNLDSLPSMVGGC